MYYGKGGKIHFKIVFDILKDNNRHALDKQMQGEGT